MAELVVTCPEQPEQVLAVSSKPVSIGRGEDCSAFIVEKKASRKHLVIREDRQGRIVAEDQDSSNGTWFVATGGDDDQRILRRVLEVGDTLRIGDTTIAVRASGGGGAPLVSGSLLAGAAVSSGSLQLTPTSEAATQEPATPDAPEPPSESRRTPSADREPAPYDDSPRTAPVDRRGLTRALMICGVALLAFIGVEIGLGSKADKQSGRKDSHLEALRVLEAVGHGSAALQAERDAFAQRFPGSPKLATIDAYLDKVREREAHEQRKGDEVNVLLGQLGQMPRSEARFRLLQLRRELPGNEEFGRKIARGLAQLDKARKDEDMDGFRAMESDVRALMGAKKFAQAERILLAFDRNHDAMDAGVKDNWSALKGEVSRAVKATAGTLWKIVKAEADPAKQRALLAAAWPSLAGTADGKRIAEQLRSAASLAAPRADGLPAGATPWEPGKTPGAAPRVPTVTDKLLARAKAAEELLAARQWDTGRAALAKLVNETEGGRLQGEWKARLAEVDQVLGLVSGLGSAVGAEAPPRRKLSSGWWTVTQADIKGVSLVSKSKGASTNAWSDLPVKDVLTLLTPPRPSLDQSHAVAVLAANLGEKDTFLATLLPVFEKGQATAETQALVARHLHGRADAPDGGYAAYKGEILDRDGVHRRKRQERIAELQATATTLLATVAKDPAFKKLAKLQAMRDELDKRRRYALTAIFNTTHYPYPYVKGDAKYKAVQDEIDRRVRSAKEIWDDPYSVKLSRDGKLAKHLASWDQVVQELEIKEIDTANLKKKMEPFSRYVTGEAITIRTFYRGAAEKEWFAYNRWVMDAYNPVRTEVARDSERRQVQVTNRYRMLLGFTAVVIPGNVPFASITKENVVQVLDQAILQKTMPLRAVRIDNRIVTSARLHSEDMSRRGYFAHQAPANPATGEGPTGPADRMQKQGYQGFGYSENIAGSASPETAHQMWIHSSGHHRNILSGWTDLGSGLGGRNFTQNFGSGGGARPEIQPDTRIRDRSSGGRGGARRRAGR